MLDPRPIRALWASVHLDNAEADVDRLLEALRRSA